MPSTRRRLLQTLPALAAAVLLLAHGPAEAARLKVGVRHVEDPGAAPLGGPAGQH